MSTPTNVDASRLQGFVRASGEPIMVNGEPAPWLIRWEKLPEEAKRGLNERLEAVPRWAWPDRSEWIAAFAVPLVWVRQYRITRKMGFGWFESLFWATGWTSVLMGLDD